VPDPHIDSLKPSSVKVNTVLTLRMIGTDFDSDCRVLIDGIAHKSQLVKNTEIQVPFDIDVTGTPGDKAFKLENTRTGKFSNEKVMTVQV
jgi:hypothetical protein